MSRLFSSCLFLLFTLFCLPGIAQVNFGTSELDLNGITVTSSTSLEFGPDGRLYVSERYGLIKALTISKNGANDYIVTSAETIDLVQNIPNHDDDGSLQPGQTTRQVTGIVVGGTSTVPILYVGSSDARVGGGGSSADKDLDTNSGTITRLTKTVTGWDAVDIIRGLPRSEENHANNGMELVTVNGTDYLMVCSGGNTNAGAPSNNFAFITEYALAAAILAVNLDALEAMPILTDAISGRQYIHDLPTLDDPTRANVNGVVDPNDPLYDGIDVGDPFGGNDGLNQAMMVVGSPVEMLSPGYRNAYDLVVTESGGMYVTENGANGGWGGFPENEGSASVTNNWRAGEPGSQTSDPDDGELKISNQDHLTWVTDDLNNYTFGSVYGGHPTPVRANVNAGLYTVGNQTSGGVYFRTVPYDPFGSGDATDPMKALPANWPPVPPALIDVANADYRDPKNANPDGPEDNDFTNLPNNTNGIDEYTASNFSGEIQGALIAGKSGGTLHIIHLNPDGSFDNIEKNKFTTGGGNPLGITCQGDGDIFPGTIWVATFDSRVYIFEPAGSVTCVLPGDSGYDPNADNDNDGYTNGDEDDNGTDMCSGASKPGDFDGDLVSDLNDLDDDGDGINDDVDPFQMGVPFDIPIVNELFSDNLELNGYLGLGLTGLMNNGDPNPNYLNWLDVIDAPGSPVNDIMGGAIGAITIYQTSGDAFNNDQEKGFQYGVNADQTTGNFVVTCRMMPPFHPHAAGESQGLFFGTGFQDDYVKIVMNSGGLSVEGEDGGVTLTGLPSGALPSTPTSSMDLLFAIDPVTGSVQAQYAIDGGAKTNLGTPFTATGAVLTAIQNASNPLAVGLIGTNGGNAEFAANWDYLNVVTDKPFVSQTLPDITRQVGAAPEDTDLNDFFDDNDGKTGLTYTVVANTNPTIAVSVTGNIMTINFPVVAAVSDITVRATDGGGLSVDQTFRVTVSDAQTVLYRLNTGGTEVVAIDGDMNWGLDGSGANSQYLFNNGSNSAGNSDMNSYHSSVDLARVPTDIYERERSDNVSNGDPDDEIEYIFPNFPNGAFEVRLYMGNSFNNTDGVGERIYSVQIEESIPLVYRDIDLITEFGHKVGGMLKFVTQVNDGNLNIRFLHGPIQNPLINGIEILEAVLGSDPIVLLGVAAQSTDEGQNANASVTGSGGTGNLVYSATGLPPGITIDPTNGLMGGTVSAGAATGSPYTVVVSVDDSDGDALDVQTVSFQWTINTPPLPVEWLSFTANEHQGDAVLDWVTGSELNNEFFEVQRSLDGRVYQTLGRVESQGNSNTNTSYRFIDKDILSLNTTSFLYRLKQVDFDGVFSFSPQVEFSVDVPFMGYPVPFDNELNVRYFPYRFDNPKIRVLSSLGQIVYESENLDKSGNLTLDTKDWPTGIYFIHLQSSRPNQVFKVIKE